MEDVTQQSSRNSTAKPGDEIAPSSYRKKPVVIQAIRWCGTNLKEVIDFTGLHPSADKWTWEEYVEVVREKGLKIFSLEGSNFIVTVGDYIIRGVKGEFYACKPDIFWMTYERESAAPVSERPRRSFNDGLRHAIVLCEGERVDAEATGDVADHAYNTAIKHCIERINIDLTQPQQDERE